MSGCPTPNPTNQQTNKPTHQHTNTPTHQHQHTNTPTNQTNNLLKTVSAHNFGSIHLADCLHGSLTGCVRHDHFFVHVCFGHLVGCCYQLLGHAGILYHLANRGHTHNDGGEPIHFFNELYILQNNPTNQSNQPIQPFDINQII
jgi:hypothetical protein